MTSSTSKKIIESLKPEEILAEQEDYLISVPQGCYAYITPETPINCVGLFTDGLHTCSGVTLIAEDETHGYLFLCHADTLTDLDDEEHGIPGWLAKIPPALTNITLYYDNVEDDFYKKILEDLVSRMGNKISITLKPCPADSSQESPDIQLVVYRNEPFNRNSALMDFDKVENLKKLRSDMVVENYKLVESAKLHPPVCIYDSRKMLSLDEIITQQRWLEEIISPPAADSVTSTLKIRGKSSTVSSAKGKHHHGHASHESKTTAVPHTGIKSVKKPSLKKY